ncbi:DoxX family protein [Virgibacillus proomii]|uniref:DoxX family protein n=1 Tax=Virgibacillus proomii TaxID=84407 RepID=UPI000987D436|nr:DoxX family protein [Virgibacillus proomii]
MIILSIVLQIILGLGFLMFGIQKLISKNMKKGFNYFGYSNSFRIFTGIFEIASAITISIGIWIKPLAIIGSLMIIVTMIGAIFTHIKMKDSFNKMSIPLVLLVLGSIVTIINLL